MREPEDWNYMSIEERRKHIEFIESEREKALKTYPKGEKIRYCPRCNEPLPYGSAAYDEGFHFDTCD